MKKLTKREWIKNIAIVFLVIMLILTFFSNTIMNRSLPEVSTQYVVSGPIVTQVRGEGTVQADDPYSVSIPETRKIAGVLVKEGDVVKEGQVLYKLEGQSGEELTTAKNDLEDLQHKFDKDILESGLTNAEVETIKKGVTINTSTILAELERRDNEIASVQKKIDDYATQISAVESKLALSEYTNVDTTKETKAKEQAQKEYDEAAAVLDLFNTYNEKDAALTEVSNTFTYWENAYNNANSTDPDYANITENYNQAATDKSNAQYEKDLAASKLPSGIDYDTALSNANSKKSALDAATKKLNDKIASSGNNEDSLNKQKIELEQAKATENTKLTSLKAERDDYYNTEKTKIDIEDAYQNILKKEAEVKDLEAKAVGGTITAPVAGTITQMNLSSGQSTKPGEDVATILPEGKGYTLSFSVTEKQARSIKVGDPVTVVNSWYYYDVNVNLTAIQPDKDNKRDGKRLVFSVSGESVEPGQSLTLSVGEKSAEYDLTVPVSAVHEDNQGKFIFIVNTKSTPFGSRYVAERVDIEELARDDKNVAIRAALFGYEYVITNSSKPIENKDQVRLAD